MGGIGITIDSATIQIRRAAPGDTCGILTLLNETFRTPIDAATWEWYTLRNPLGPNRVYVAAHSGSGEIAGVIGFAPLSLRLKGARIRTVYAHHLALQRQHRSAISYLALCGEALEAEARCGTTLIIGPPNKRAYPIHKVLGKWVDFGHLDCLRKTIRSSRANNCRKVEVFSSDFDYFYSRVAEDLSLCIEKNAVWANWRFCSRPGSPYSVYTVGESGSMSGYVVLKRWEDPDGYRKAHIVDLHALNKAALADLVGAAESYGYGCDELNLWAAKGYPYRAWLERCGFTAGPRQPLLIRTLNGSAVEYPDGACSLSYGDGDSQY